MDSIEVQQMKAQAKEEKARKKVSERATDLTTQRVSWKKGQKNNESLPLHLDGTSNSGPRETNERGSGASEGGNGEEALPVAG